VKQWYESNCALKTSKHTSRKWAWSTSMVVMSTGLL
jgi:hypothetical protein